MHVTITIPNRTASDELVAHADGLDVIVTHGIASVFVRGNLDIAHSIAKEIELEDTTPAQRAARA